MTYQLLSECVDSAKYTARSTDNVQVYKHREKHYNAKSSTLDASLVRFLGVEEDFVAGAGINSSIRENNKLIR
jgi:hypothetical protein